MKGEHKSLIQINYGLFSHKLDDITNHFMEIDIGCT